MRVPDEIRGPGVMGEDGTVAPAVAQGATEDCARAEVDGVPFPAAVVAAAVEIAHTRGSEGEVGIVDTCGKGVGVGTWGAAGEGVGKGVLPMAGPWPRISPISAGVDAEGRKTPAAMGGRTTPETSPPRPMVGVYAERYYRSRTPTRKTSAVSTIRL